MTGTQDTPSGPDLAQGLALDKIADGAMLAGRVDDEAVLVARRGEEIFAVGATCTHYSGPLSEGILVGETVRCPWHHACFSLRTGVAVRAPAFAALPRWRVELRGDTVFVREKTRGRSAAPARPKLWHRAPDRSSSSEAEPRALPPPRCFAARDLAAPSRC